MSGAHLSLLGLHCNKKAAPLTLRAALLTHHKTHIFNFILTIPRSGPEPRRFGAQRRPRCRIGHPARNVRGTPGGAERYPARRRGHPYRRHPRDARLRGSLIAWLRREARWRLRIGSGEAIYLLSV